MIDRDITELVELLIDLDACIGSPVAREAANALQALSCQITQLTEERDRLREALEELVDTLTPTERGPIKDPTYGDEVREMGLRIGFGALMASAEYEWRAWLAENGYPLGSEFVSGPCRAVLDSDMKKAHAALFPPSVPDTREQKDIERADRLVSGTALAELEKAAVFGLPPAGCHHLQYEQRLRDAIEAVIGRRVTGEPE